MKYLAFAVAALLCASCAREQKAASTPAALAAIPGALPVPPAGYVPVQLVAPEGPPEVLPGGYLKIGFDRLSTFPFELYTKEATAAAGAEKPREEDQIPEEIQGYDGKKVLVTGFMLATKLSGGLVTDLILQKDQFTCCYGGMPQMNDFILVKFANGGVKNVPDVPLSFYGTLRVKVKRDSIGFVTHIYELDAERQAPEK